MTDGTVVVLGETGRNFGAGMSGGIAYVIDRSDTLARYMNMAMVELEPVRSTAEQMNTTDPSSWHLGECDEIILKKLIEQHFRLTGSTVARDMLDDWDRTRSQFKKVFPTEYRRALGEMHAKKQAKEAQKTTA